MRAARCRQALVSFQCAAMTNPIVTANIPCTGTCLAVVPGVAPGTLAQEDANGSNARVWGLEFGLDNPDGLS